LSASPRSGRFITNQGVNMTVATMLSPARRLAVLIAAAAIILAGCQKNSEPATAADLSGEYAAPAVEAPAATAGASIKVAVSLSPALAKKAAPTDTVFVFARPAQGPRMPLAIVRLQVKDLPTTVVLDDSHGMSPQMSLSSVPEVVVVARVSKSGMAAAAPGDLEGVSAPVKVGQAISISIAKVVAGP